MTTPSLASIHAAPGTVYLVGAGPGDPDLASQRCVELLRAGDVLLVDKLAAPELVRLARGGAEVVDVGKVAGRHAMPQDEINARLVAEAQRGRVVVRLKGGDPYLFGRGGEEAAFCREHGIPFEVVPAVTSAFAACADAGIPVTHRDVARHVTVVTASAGRDGQGDPDYAWLAGSDGTVVLLMGLRRVAHVCEQLVANGKPAGTPAAVVSRGTTPGQRTVVGTLADLAARVEREQPPSPAIIVVGKVVRLREQLAWFEQRPLFGRRVAVTRARAQASGLVRALQRLGAEVVEAPAIRTEVLDPRELDAVIADLDAVHTLAFTSANGVHAFFDRLAHAGRDARALAGVRIAAVGTPSDDALRSRGVAADVLPPRGARSGAGLLDALRAGTTDIAGASYVVVRAQEGDDALVDGLRADGAVVSLVAAYRTVVETPGADLVDSLVTCDVITFTSASTVSSIAAHLPAATALPPAVTIGPTTSRAAIDAGFRVAIESTDPSVESVVDAVLELLGRD